MVLDGNGNRAFLLNPDDSFQVKEHLGRESYRAAQLSGYIRQSEFVLDLHSTTQESPPFAYVAEGNIELAKTLGLSFAATYTPNEYLPVIGSTFLNKKVDLLNGTLQSFCDTLGIDCVTVECGSHLDPNSVANAKAVIARALAHKGLISEDHSLARASNQISRFAASPSIARLTYLVAKKSDHDMWLIENPRNFQPVSAGEKLIRFGDGTYCIADQDSVLILPTPIKIQQDGEEICILARVF